MSDYQLIDKLNLKLRHPLKQHQKLTWFLRGYQLDEVGNVTHLNVFKSGFDNAIPEEVFQFKHLQQLDLRNNNLIELPQEINQLKGLNTLDIRHNQLKDLSINLSKLLNLEKLYLANNLFECIPTVLAHLEALWLIDFSENQIHSGLEHLLKAEMLTNIYLKDNKIESFPFEKIEGYIDELVLSENLISVSSEFKHPLINKLFL
ncbi:leucine-rich repeat domain-containing protein [Carboxylicivirga linearis]|uniref:Leucine-rich repeat domain-containing protein n=1 Tax=Carboxylicivirga linearis TaxID=1628157 RepID=A0ABS5K1J1_9BACT|nr:leucine-rich repeat domain-containing protein [Carboxylicivirga linearis]MBS2100546.1 leucine-rich repeat domain-containing protein [Carboxylicivirga linearis]